jgi:hypothetical protein
MSEPPKRRPFTTSPKSRPSSPQSIVQPTQIIIQPTPKRRPFTTSPSPPKSRSSPPQSIVQPTPKRRPFTTSPSPPKSRPSPPQSIVQPTPEFSLQPPQSIVDGRDYSLLPKQRQGTPPPQSIVQPTPEFSLQPPQSIVDGRDLEKTIFIIVACHGRLSTTDVRTSCYPTFKPNLVKCNIRNLQKKTIAKLGCKPLLSNQLPRHTPNSKRLLGDMYSPRDLPYDPDDIKDYVAKLSKLEKDELYKKTIDKTTCSKHNPCDPIQLSKDIIDDYVHNNRNLSKTHPTKPGIIQQYHRGVYLTTHITPGCYPSSFDKDYANNTISCDIQQDKEQYWESIYDRDDEHATGIIVSFMIGSEMMYYDLYEISDHIRLISDLLPHVRKPQITRDVRKPQITRDVRKPQITRDVTNPQISDPHFRELLIALDKSKKGNVNYNQLKNITTSDIFNIVKSVQDILDKDNVVFIDFACKGVSCYGRDVEKEEVEETLRDTGLFDETKMGYGGYHKNKYKSRKYKSKKYKSRKYKSRKYKSRKYKSRKYKSRKYKSKKI